MKTTIPISKKNICAFVRACRLVDVEYRSTKANGKEFISYEVAYESPFALFQLGTIFEMFNK